MVRRCCSSLYKLFHHIILIQFAVIGSVGAIGPCSIGAPGLEGLAPSLAIPGMPTIPGIPLLNKNLKCTEKGYFELVQCVGGDYCVCVDPSTGAEATATKTSSNKIRPQCGRCHFQLSRYYRDAKNFVFRPICDAKTGNYQPQQCRDEKHCFCVNVISGVRLSKKEVPSGDNLQCEGSEFDFSIDDSHLIKTEKGEGGKANEQLIPLGSPICKKPKDAGNKCHAGVAVGPIAAKNLKWYFDTDTFECLAFAYSGCGGNGNRFDSPAECWEKCKLADLSGCAGMRLPATNKQGHTIICAGPGQPTPGACPSGYRCTMLAHMGVCCHSATQDLYECNYRPTCANGGQAMQMHSRGVPMTLIGKKCADNFCPIGAKCVEKEIFAHCC